MDRYGRTVGEVILPNGQNLNQELVRAGLVAPPLVDFREHEDHGAISGNPAPAGAWERPHLRRQAAAATS